MNMRRLACITLVLSILLPVGSACAGQWQLVSDNGRMGLMVDISSIQKLPKKRLMIDRIAIDNTESLSVPIEISTLEIDCPSGDARVVGKRTGSSNGTDRPLNIRPGAWSPSNTARLMCPRPAELQDYGRTPLEAARAYNSATAFQRDDLPAANATLRHLILGAHTEAKQSTQACQSELVEIKLGSAALHAIFVADVNLAINERERHYRLSRRAVWQAMEWVENCRSGPSIED